MLDLILGWSVIFFPFALAVVFIFIPARAENERAHLRWRYGLVAFGVCFSAVAWWQQARAARSASEDREVAIKETSARVAAETTDRVTKALALQYAQTINDLHLQIGRLQGQLEHQGRSVEAIRGSNIVTGKNPIRVEVTNPMANTSGGELPLNVHASTMATTPNPQYGTHATLVILTTNKRMNGAHLSVTCKDKLNRGEAWISGSGYMMGGGRLTNDHTFQIDIGPPDWSPEFPLTITFYHDAAALDTCNLALR